LEGLGSGSLGRIKKMGANARRINVKATVSQREEYLTGNDRSHAVDLDGLRRRWRRRDDHHQHQLIVFFCRTESDISASSGS
jgi:hypothetical protein